MTEQTYSPQQLQAYNALKIAAERIGANGYEAERLRRGLTKIHAAKGLRGKGGVRSIYTPTEQHLEVIEAMPKVLSGEISPEEAMALLWRGDVERQRLGLT